MAFEPSYNGEDYDGFAGSRDFAGEHDPSAEIPVAHMSAGSSPKGRKLMPAGLGNAQVHHWVVIYTLAALGLLWFLGGRAFRGHLGG